MQRPQIRNNQTKPTQIPELMCKVSMVRSIRRTEPLAETIAGSGTRRTEVEFELIKEKTGTRLTGVTNNGTSYRIIYAGVHEVELPATKNPEIGENKIFRCFVLRKNGEQIKTIHMSLEGNRIVVGNMDKLDICIHNNVDGSKTRIILNLK